MSEIRSNSTSFGPSAAVADTDSAIGAQYTIERDANIKKIRIVGYNGVTDKATSAVLKMKLSRTKGPFDFACYAAGEEITVGGKRQTEEIDVDVPVTKGETIDIEVKASEALEDIIVSLTYV